MMLLRETLQEWLPEGHLPHFIFDMMDELDLGAIHVRYDKGSPRQTITMGRTISRLRCGDGVSRRNRTSAHRCSGMPRAATALGGCSATGRASTVKPHP